jgi:hypothetical protein
MTRLTVPQVGRLHLAHRLAHARAVSVVGVAGGGAAHAGAGQAVGVVPGEGVGLGDGGCSGSVITIL